jgi:MYND finger
MSESTEHTTEDVVLLAPEIDGVSTGAAGGSEASTTSIAAARRADLPDFLHSSAILKYQTCILRDGIGGSDLRNQPVLVLHTPMDGDSRYTVRLCRMELELKVEPESMVKACCKCYTVIPNLLRCAVCKTICYCSSACQKADWLIHKQVCAAVKDVLTRRINDEMVMWES